MRPSLYQARYQAALDYFDATEEEQEEIIEAANDIRWPNSEPPADERY